MATNGGMRMKLPSLVRLIIAVCFLALIPVPCLAPFRVISEAEIAPLTPAHVFDEVKDSVVVVKTLDAQGKVSAQGSGVLIPSRRVATNCHVVEGGSSYLVGRGKQLVRASLYAEDGDKDICLLDAKGIQGKPVQLGKAARLKVGDPVYAVGAPQGLELSLSDGIVAQLRGGPPPFIQTTAAISPGSSGGGLFDGEARLIGLTTFYVEGGQSLNFAMPAEWIGEVKPGRKPAAEGPSHTEWLKRAFALEQTKDQQGLLEWCRKWTKKEPENVDAWYNLGISHLHLDRYSEAIEAYRRAIRIDPKNTYAWNGLGLAYRCLKRYDDAIEAYRQALRIDPKDTRAWNGLGHAHAGLNIRTAYNGKVIAPSTDAIEAFRQAIRIDPEYADAWSGLGFAYSYFDRYNDAIEAFRQVVRIEPKNADAWWNLGNSYEDLDRHDDAIEAYRQALRIDPKNALAWNNLAVAYNLSGNRTAALDAVRELGRLDPESAERLFNLIVPR